MRILFSSHVFAPSIGGLETVSRSLAEEFVRQGHEVQLVTQTPATVNSSPNAQPPPFPIWRRPPARTLLGLTRWCDVYFHNNISLPRAWPILLVPRPWIVAHHVWIPRSGMAARLKRFSLRFATGISISEAIAEHLSTPSAVIPNPYDDVTFRAQPDVSRTRDLIFVGRLVSDKGVSLLVEALAALRDSGLRAELSVVGTGPEEPHLRDQTAKLGLQTQVRFLGTRRGPELARILSEHRIIVVPSVWQEPFGIVALEAIACGCVAVGSEGGGLRDAMGPCGITFPNGDRDALCQALALVLRDPDRLETLRRPAAQHLRRHHLENVAQEYLAVFAAALRGRRLHANRGTSDAG
jgi:glycogen(starch) synthase